MTTSARTPPKDSLAYCVERFPGWQRLIFSEYRRSESFRSLCDDFSICASAMSKWHCSDAAAARQRESEYAECLAELEQEIREWLERLQPADTSTGRDIKESES